MKMISYNVAEVNYEILKQIYKFYKIKTTKVVAHYQADDGP